MRNGRNRVAPAVLVVILSCEYAKGTPQVYVHLLSSSIEHMEDQEVEIHVCLYVPTTSGVFPTTSGAVFPTTSRVFQKCIGLGKNLCKNLYSLDIV